MTRWFDRREDRLALEAKLLAQYYPGAKLVIKDNQLRIWIVVDGRLGKYIAELIYSKSFPHEPLRAYIRSPKIEGCPHFFRSSSEVCMYHLGEVGPSTTGKVYCDWLMEWIDHYEQWQQTGAWQPYRKAMQ